MKLFLLLLPALGLAGAAVAQLTPAVKPLEAPPVPLPSALEKSVKGLVADGRLDCIRFSDAVDPKSADATILWRTGMKLAYRNDTNGGCFGLKRDDRIVIESIKGRVCKGDIVRTVERTSGTPSGSCSLGEFVRYAPPGTR